MKVSFSKVITKKWKSHLEVWIVKRHLHGWLLAKPYMCVCVCGLNMSMVPALSPDFGIGLCVKSKLKKKLTVCHMDQSFHAMLHTKRQNFQTQNIPSI
jgi:hypothetical protein